MVPMLLGDIVYLELGRVEERRELAEMVRWDGLKRRVGLMQTLSRIDSSTGPAWGADDICWTLSDGAASRRGAMRFLCNEMQRTTCMSGDKHEDARVPCVARD